MSNSEGLYDVHERIGNLKHVSIDEVVELVFERAASPGGAPGRASQQDDSDCCRQVRAGSVRTVIHRVLIDYRSF